MSELGKQEFWFFDLDDDGLIRPEMDGFAIKGIPFCVPLPESLLLEVGQFEIRADPEMGELRLTPDPLDLNPRMILRAAYLTELRLQVGLQPVRLVEEASKHCDLHIEYLKLNQLTDGGTGLVPHEEDPTKPGYTEEGRAAGAGSNLGFQKTDYREAIREWYATLYHGAVVVDPALRAVGIGLEHGVAMLYAWERDGLIEEAYLHPPDGATAVPRNFAVGEVPDPVPDVKSRPKGSGCGFPVHIRLGLQLRGKRLLDAKLFDGKGRSVPGKFSCPENPANPKFPANSGCAFFIPLDPLAGKSRHRAEFLFQGFDEPIVWEFTTSR